MNYREQCGNGSVKDLAGISGIGDAEKHSRTHLKRSLCVALHGNET